LDSKKKKKKKNKKKKNGSDLQSDLDTSLVLDNGTLEEVDDTHSNTNQTN
jgi:hypothetical protein